MRSSDEVKNQPKNFARSHDQQISSSTHDEILVWLYEKIQNNSSFVRRVFLLEESDEIIDVVRKIEYPLIKSDPRGLIGSIIGFADMACQVKYKNREIDNIIKSQPPVPWGIEHTKLSSEEKQIRTEKYEKFQKDIDANARLKFYSFGDGICRKKMFFEVKTSVNIGETIRQLNYYSQGVSEEIQWIVCAPPFAQSKVLVEQGIRFLPYTPDKK